MDGSLAPPAPRDGIQDRGMRLFAVQLGFLLAAVFFVLARAYVKTCIVKGLTVEDWLIFGAMLGYTAHGVLVLHGIIYGATGKHLTEVTVNQAAISLRAWYICEVLYSPITLAIRTSICLVLLRLTFVRVHRLVIYANLVVVWIISFAFFCIVAFQCMPPSYFWRQLYGGSGSCNSFNLVPITAVTHSIILAMSDWFMGLLPIVLLWNVNLNWRTKALVAALLGLGITAGIALIIRIPYVRRFDVSADFLYESIDVAIWSVLEPALGIMAASVTSLRPLFKSWISERSKKIEQSRRSETGWIGANGYREAKRISSPSARADKSENSNFAARTSDDIGGALSGTESDIELKRTFTDDVWDEHEDCGTSRQSFNLSQRSHVQNRLAREMPVSIIRTTTNVLPRSKREIDQIWPLAEGPAGKEEDNPIRGRIGDRGSSLA
ncbi:integral membrane protein [Colletotrichum nymphaeae SA-01]|uniref:Integral membrane protein n=1 Tax=Colletotrichum nymphaeae SA-01 TaxID=1460502 RepID=A0A135UQ23_9PEZI|nr:integral membrane protein [Colletotrichum nymphaeae SA-01]